MGDTVFYMRSSSPFGINGPFTEQAIDDLRAFVKIDESYVTKALTALDKSSLFMSKDELSSQLKAELPDTEAQLLGRVIRLLHRAYQEGQGFNLILRHLESIESVEESPEQAFSQDDLAVFRHRTERLAIAWSALDRQKKAEELCIATGQRLQSSQLVCDLRPIFDVTRKCIQGFLPITTLHLVHEGVDGLPNGLDIILSETDVDMLAGQLANAKGKLIALRELAVQTNTPIPTTDLTRAAKD